MHTIRTVDEVRTIVSAARRDGAVIGFVPTMGYLHEGHLSLIRRARSECGFVVTSVFVNPMQFGPREDFASYPRDLHRDAELAGVAGSDLLFTPEAGEVYPPGFTTRVEVAGLSNVLCGASRPGHFRGVTTVVARLFNLVRPDRAYFGQKDAQQLVIVRRMVRDLAMDVEVVSVPTVRETDGLAMSSRNVYLSPEERVRALALHRALEEARRLIEAGARNAKTVRAAMDQHIRGESGVRLEYAEVTDAETLQPLKTLRGRILLVVAARVGRARLIDNLVLEVSATGVSETTL